MNIAIVDDFARDSNMLVELIEKYSKENYIQTKIFCFNNGEQFIKEANLYNIDSLFLDIYMDELNGIQVAKWIRERGGSFPIVFLTSSKSHAIESYEIRAFDYILKPIDKEKLYRVMKLLQAKIKDRFIIVKEGREPKKIVLSEIVYVDQHNHYLQIHTKDSVVRTYQKFSDFEEEVSKYNMFLTCQRCIIINMDQIEKIEKGFFIMRNGEYVSINRNRSKEIKTCYFNYVFGEMERSGND